MRAYAPARGRQTQNARDEAKVIARVKEKGALLFRHAIGSGFGENADAIAFDPAEGPEHGVTVNVPAAQRLIGAGKLVPGETLDHRHTVYRLP